MDKNWESILYIVITAIIIIASAFKKKKKTGQSITKPGEQNKPFNFMDVLQSNISEIVENIEEPTINYTKEKKEDPIEKKQPVFIEGEDAIIVEKEKKDMYNISSEEENKEEFDLKKAIIYSEIINRKQF